MKLLEVHSLFTDGGCLSRNPSTIGGTWAWCALDQSGKMIKCQSGIVLPGTYGLKKISNNFTELYAAFQALSVAPPEWNGTLYTDSKITLLRLTDGKSFHGVPQELRSAVLKLRQVGLYQVKLVGGHPTKRELIQGRINRNGLPTSRWNVYVDKLCQQQAKRYLERQEE